MAVVWVIFVLIAGQPDHELDPHEFATKEACEVATKLVLPRAIEGLTLECRPRHSAGVSGDEMPSQP